MENLQKIFFHKRKRKKDGLGGEKENRAEIMKRALHFVNRSDLTQDVWTRQSKSKVIYWWGSRCDARCASTNNSLSSFFFFVNEKAYTSTRAIVWTHISRDVCNRARRWCWTGRRRIFLDICEKLHQHRKAKLYWSEVFWLVFFSLYFAYAFETFEMLFFFWDINRHKIRKLALDRQSWVSVYYYKSSFFFFFGWKSGSVWAVKRFPHYENKN